MKNKRVWMPFEEARTYVHKFNLKTKTDWEMFSKSGKRPKNIPSEPYDVYMLKGWAGYGDWLGTGRIATYLKVFRSFDEARSFVHQLKLKNYAEWRNYYKSSSKPSDIPTNPSVIYKDKGWLGYGDWLGKVPASLRIKNFLPYAEARTFVHTLNLKNRKEWFEYYKSGKKPDNIPAYPFISYKNNGWIGWQDWLRPR
jgi:hypothetical protein